MDAALMRWEESEIPVFDEDGRDDIAAYVEFQNQGSNTTLESAPTLRLLDDVELMALRDPEWLVDGVLPRRGVVCIVGPPGSYKTTMAAALLRDVAIGASWYGHRVCYRAGGLYVGAEDVSGFKLRLAAAKRAARLSLSDSIGVYTYPDAIDLRNSDNVQQFIAGIRAHGAAFEIAVIDTYASCTPGSAENSSEDTTAAMVAAQQIRDGLTCSVVLIHHTNAAGSRERGHSGMRGAADTLLMLEPVDDVVHVRCEKQRNGPHFETLTLKPVPVDGGGIVLRLASEVLPSTALSAQQLQVLAALRDIAGSDGQTKTAWRAACAGVTERSFYKVANVLEEKGYVVKIGTHFRIGKKP
jgi:hypothetical protein